MVVMHKGVWFVLSVEKLEIVEGEEEYRYKRTEREVWA